VGELFPISNEQLDAILKDYPGMRSRGFRRTTIKKLKKGST